jgi:hypothetical protein
MLWEETLAIVQRCMFLVWGLKVYSLVIALKVTILLNLKPSINAYVYVPVLENAMFEKVFISVYLWDIILTKIFSWLSTVYYFDVSFYLAFMWGQR